MPSSVLKMKKTPPQWECTTEMAPNQAAANLRWLVQNGHMNEAWAVNQSSRGFTAQLSESWAYLSPYSAEQKKKHTLLSLHFLALSLPSTSSLLPAPSPLWWMEGMNSPWPPRVSLWGPQQLNKQHALNLKAQSGIYLNHVRFRYICVWPWSAREGTWKIDFCRAVITQTSFFFLTNSATVNKPFTSSD